MKGRSDIPLILGRLRPSKRLTSIQVLCQCPAMCVGTCAMQSINFFKHPMGGALNLDGANQTFEGVIKKINE